MIGRILADRAIVSEQLGNAIKNMQAAYLTGNEEGVNKWDDEISRLNKKLSFLNELLEKQGA